MRTKGRYDLVSSCMIATIVLCRYAVVSQDSGEGVTCEQCQQQPPDATTGQRRVLCRHPRVPNGDPHPTPAGENTEASFRFRRRSDDLKTSGDPNGNKVGDPCYVQCKYADEAGFLELSERIAAGVVRRRRETPDPISKGSMYEPAPINEVNVGDDIPNIEEITAECVACKANTIPYCAFECGPGVEAISDCTNAIDGAGTSEARFRRLHSSSFSSLPTSKTASNDHHHHRAIEPT